MLINFFKIKIFLKGMNINSVKKALGQSMKFILHSRSNSIIICTIFFRAQYIIYCEIIEDFNVTDI
jgi:hypothetical protein